MNPDILCLQETKALDKEIEKMLGQINGYHHFYNAAEKKGCSGTD